jgi:lipopolysaccharide transport system permease protein
MGQKSANKNLPVVVYTSASCLRSSGKMAREMWSDLKASKELAWRLFVRNISGQYRQTILGYLWVLLPPVVTTMLWVFLNAQKVLVIQETESPYPVYVLIGTLLWRGFVDAMNSPHNLLVSSKAMITKVNFPHEALILAGCGEVLVNFSIRLLLVFILFFWFPLEVPLTIFLAPLGMLSVIVLGLMIGLLLAPLSLLYGDIQKGMVLLTSLWFFLTPIVYPPPSQWPASLLAKINPVSPLIITTRQWMTTGEFSQITGFLIVACSAFVLLLVAWIVYRVAMPHLIERMSA